MNVEELKIQLTYFEGRVSHAYQDSEGYWTIGVGHLIDEKLGGHLDDDVIDHQLNNDIERVETDLQSFSWWVNLNSVRQVALANLRFQLGPNRFRGFKNMISALEIGDFDSVAFHLLDSTYAKQVPKRANFIADKLKKGV